MTNDDFEIVKKVARATASRWSLVDVEDIQSELVLWLLENPHVSKAYSDESNKGKLVVALRRRATEYARKEQTILQGGFLIDLGVYSLEQLTRALPYVYEDTPQTIAHDFENFSGAHGLALAVMTDLKQALSRLTDKQQKTLRQRFRDHMTFQEIGDIEGITKRAAKKRVDRALDELRITLKRAN